MSTDSLTILIIDDNRTLLEDYKLFLEDSGMHVITADTARKGIDVAEKKSPQIIILDLMMPEVNGIEALEELKTNEATKQIPVIVFTALVNELEKNESLKNGAIEYLEKLETSPAQLLHKIKHYVKK